MSSYRVKPFRTILFTMATAALVLTSCGADSDPLDDNGEDTNASDSIVIGSQAYYSNEIIAEIYAQVLEDEGFEVEREFQIGQREVYMPELEDGELDLLPDYTGNLVQYYQDDADTGSPEEVHQQAQEAMPDELQVLDFAEATDQDSYTVTSETADKYDLESIGDLSDVGDSVSMAANSEFESRPYGPDGADDVYGVTVKVVGVEDSGGPLTVGALLDGDVEVADIYTSSPSIAEEDLVVLDDPEHLILPQNVVPVASAELDDKAVDIVNDVQADLSLDELIQLNTRSVEDEASASDIASQWLEDRD
ncbi:MAG TPA: ABC transporter substrate-binding protein [Candidatus Yaniella excrementigallinarum]|nr:ABC transporter substrate-binding protein [Candidatus Yaniella excrementigallinarum]